MATALLLVIANASPRVAAAAESLDVGLLRAAAPDAAPRSVVAGTFDASLESLPDRRMRPGPRACWLKLVPLAGAGDGSGIPVLVFHASRRTRIELFSAVGPIPGAAELPGFRGTQDKVFTVPSGAAGRPLYAHVESAGGELRDLTVSTSTLGGILDRGAGHARMIALTVGALLSLACAALLIWFLLAEQLFVLYASLFFLESLYIVFLSGQGFDWPGLSLARPLMSFAWNVPVGLSGVVSCLFTREITDLRRYWPRIYSAFGWLAVVFGILTAANVAKLFGYGILVNAVGNAIFCGLAVFTLVVAYLSWRRGNRAAGWFLIAWALLEGSTLAVAARFLLMDSQNDDSALYYYGLPASMVAAAILIALGVADRLRQQRDALSDAERRAQTDPLTGVLNRRSLIERVDAACSRARSRGLPTALLFIDLDHFKLINDSFGHQAGDACLRAIIEPIHAELRQSDAIGRYGGEEFVVLLSGADAAAALPIAQRILERVANVRVDGYGRPIQLTCSIGVAASDTLGAWGENLIASADAAVYVAKRAGRNQVHLAVAAAAEPERA